MHTRTQWTMTFLVGLLLLTGSAAIAEDPQPTADKSTTGQAPTLTEIAKANDAAWEAIKSVDMVYDLSSHIVANGKKGRELRSTDIHWAKEGNRERLRGLFRSAELESGDFGRKDRCEYEDIFLDGTIVRQLTDSAPENKDKGELSYCDQKGLRAEIRPETSRMLAIQKKSPELLRYLMWSIRSSSSNMTNGSPLTLSEIISSWKVSLKEKQTTNAGDTLWLIHAEYPPKNSDDKLAGSYMDIYVNADKDFLIQKVLWYANNVVSKDGKRVGIYYTEEVEEFQDCGHGIYFPKRVQYRLIGEAEQISSEDGFYATQTATKLSLNTPLPDDAFDFRFPENVVVMQYSQSVDEPRFLIWGPDNKPVKEFNTSKEFEEYAEKEELELLRQRVEKNRSSTKPSDLVERGGYCLQTKQYGAAITAFSEAISVHPTPDEVLSLRGMAYLCKQDFAKAIADFTKCVDHAPEKEGLGMCYYFRGLAYANDESTLGKAVADMTEALRLDPNIQGALTGAHLVCSVAQARNGNLAEALTDATKAIEVDPEDADAYAVRCYVYEKNGDHDKATADRETSKRLRKETPHSSIALEVVFADALHHCLLQLVPTLE